ncbi:hypothetical protein FISHEDRAFT_66082 [Fistulina hepatica ATCC 64428]|uniref:Uncharacterized protein n=1 Tax=Fistulina hepatica ATCC 64428 TaxID=1128425 RepID=A0A0D7A952_9AGAR|nr:hypothetical protein FISHEDRAFT_66082 [Fistulina hepatica ATCC 64428]
MAARDSGKTTITPTRSFDGGRNSFAQADGPKTTFPHAKPARKASTRDTIIHLVDMLLREKGISAVTAEEQTEVGDDGDVREQAKVRVCSTQLRDFAHASRGIGSSVAILSSAFHLRGRLAQILFLFHENAADLFPSSIRSNAIQHALVPPNTPAIGTDDKDQRRRYKKHAKKNLTNITRPKVDTDLDLEAFPEQFLLFAEDVVTFLHSLNEFPEFYDETVNDNILSFEADLKYWASCLEVYHGQFKYPAVQSYVHDLASEMGVHLDSMTVSLNMFLDVGVPTIRFAQKHGADNLLNLSTVATFFSAVTATTMQFSYNLVPGADDVDPTNYSVADGVNCFWFASLVFSIAAAVNSLLGLTWKQAMYRSPGHRVPWWVLIWIKRSPLVFLVMSVACFSIGLCLFAYASNQAAITATLTTVLTIITSFGLAAVSMWFIFERFIYLRHRGRKWLSDELDDYWKAIEDALVQFGYVLARVPGIATLGCIIVAAWSSCVWTCRLATSSLMRLSSRSVTSLRRLGHWSASDLEEKNPSEDDLEAGRLPMTVQDTQVAASSDGPRPSSATLVTRATRPSDASAKSPTHAFVRSSVDTGPLSPSTVAPSVVSDIEAAPTTSRGPETPSRGKQLWRNAIKTVTMSSRMSSAFGSPTRSPVSASRQRSASTVVQHVRGSSGPLETTKISRSRVATLSQKLRILEPTQDLTVHFGLVRHLQFSPDGKWLSTSSWDRTSIIFRVGHPLSSHRVLAHTKGFVYQVAWSPKGDLLLTRMLRAIKIWTVETGVCKKTIERGDHDVESVAWLPDGTAFLSVEGCDDLKGNILEVYGIERVKIHDVSVTPDAKRFVGVGPLLRSPTGLVPSRSRAEKQLIVYNMETKQLENQTPVLNDVRDITLARNTQHGLLALVSYENKVCPSSLSHTYMPKTPVSFAGPSYFGGKNDELVLCAGKAGDIHIWDRESGALLHHVRGQQIGGDLTCIAWNNAAEDPFMFATGSHDGGVRIWTSPERPNIAINDSDGIPGGLASPQEPSSAPLSREPSRTRYDVTAGAREGSLDIPRVQHGFRDRAISFARQTPSPQSGGSQ